MSGVGLLLPYRTPAVEPDPGIDTAERQAGAWSYSGIAAEAPPSAESGTLGITGTAAVLRVSLPATGGAVALTGTAATLLAPAVPPAFDAASESHTVTGTGSASQASFTWEHDPGVPPTGVLVFVFTNAAANLATSVTYEGVTVPLVPGSEAQDTAGEPGAVVAYFLGANVPTADTATVVVNRTNNATVMYAVCITLSGPPVLRVVGAPSLLEENGTMSAVALDTGTVPTLRFAAAQSGLPDVSATPALGVLAPATGSTLLHSNDFVARVVGVVRETTGGTGSRSVGFTTSTSSDDRAVVHVAIGPPLLPLTADAGSVTGTGTAATLRVALLASPGAITLTGTAATGQRILRLLGATGTVALTGTDTPLRVRMPVAAGSGTLTGTDAALVYGAVTILLAEAGSVTVTGTAATLRGQRRVLAESGTALLTGTAVIPRLTLPVTAGASTVTGSAAALIYGTVTILLAEAGSGLLTGTAATFTVTHRLLAAPGTVALTGTAAAGQAHRVLSGSAGSVVLTATPALMQLRMPAGAGSSGISGTAATLEMTWRLVAGAGTVTGAGTDADFFYSVLPSLLADAGVLTVNGTAVTLLVVLPATSATVSLLGTAAAFVPPPTWHRGTVNGPGHVGSVTAPAPGGAELRTVVGAGLVGAVQS